MNELSFNRILDANANRAREGFRTAEDYVRFLTGARGYAEHIRGLRQAVTRIIASVPALAAALVEARNVGADPLRPENWKDLLRRVESETPLQTAIRGLKRGQEALRVLEENLRGQHPDQAEEFSKLRYGAYEAEQWLTCSSQSMSILQAARLMVLLSREACGDRDAEKVARAILRGGVKVLQVREKNLGDRQGLQWLSKISGLCGEHGAILICNDRVDLGLLSGASGVHLGADDLPLAEARKLCGRRLLVGVSTHTATEAQAACEQGADYIGLGAMFPTATKKDIRLGGLEVAKQVAVLNLSVPVFAIGGISLERIPELRRNGMRRAAVCHDIVSAPDPEARSRKFLEALDE